MVQAAVTCPIRATSFAGPTTPTRTELAAAPAQYRVTGVETFIVGPSGVVYQKDLGPDTLKTFQSMERFNPDKTRQPTDDQWSESGEQGAAE